MANFKVGQRVRKICPGIEKYRTDGRYTAPIGSEGVIVGTAFEYHYEWKVVYDGVRDPLYGFNVADSDMLAPLTDPKADEFIERIKKIAREPITTKELA